jgi:hypothetical protein
MLSRLEEFLEVLREDQERIADHVFPIDASIAATEIFGYPGAMLSGSKTARPGHVVVWNANVCSREHGKMWFGDIDLTDGGYDKANALADKLGVTVYVLREMDARFENERSPKFENAVYSTEKEG